MRCLSPVRGIVKIDYLVHFSVSLSTDLVVRLKPWQRQPSQYWWSEHGLFSFWRNISCVDSGVAKVREISTTAFLTSPNSLRLIVSSGWNFFGRWALFHHLGTVGMHNMDRSISDLELLGGSLWSALGSGIWGLFLGLFFKCSVHTFQSKHNLTSML